ncbi:hypothetical protein DTO164E3_5772 [Paecilomyces variotii]|nr:hypothetical protein DTO164E3_5772 [Paecilomyces variotii]KAJ9233315.1 hypothetical protein DTO169E5_7126 [Paecilomyces variotii]KAJ9355996.1 hypothetical protein DTO027B9_3838 [Paecilomyces variotii]KAJ9410046.1 hypothetical protein DTO045G8_2039 [Paecilomyces variotii]
MPDFDGARFCAIQHCEALYRRAVRTAEREIRFTVEVRSSEVTRLHRDNFYRRPPTLRSSAHFHRADSCWRAYRIDLALSESTTERSCGQKISGFFSSLIAYLLQAG